MSSLQYIVVGHALFAYNKEEIVPLIFDPIIVL